MSEKHTFSLMKKSMCSSEFLNFTNELFQKLLNKLTIIFGDFFLKSRMHTKDDQIELMLRKDLISDGVIRTKYISEKINRSERQTRRYLVTMSKYKMISLTDSKRLEKSQGQIQKHHFKTITRDDFVQIPER